MKVLDPQRVQLPAGNYRWLWLDRDHRQQAKSQVKFLRNIAGIPCGKEMISPLAKSYEKDKPACMAAIRSIGGPVREMRFEYIINSPSAAAVDIGIFAGCGHREKMASVVRKRSTLCLPYFLEAELLKEEMSRAGLA